MQIHGASGYSNIPLRRRDLLPGPDANPSRIFKSQLALLVDLLAYVGAAHGIQAIWNLGVAPPILSLGKIRLRRRGF